MITTAINPIPFPPGVADITLGTVATWSLFIVATALTIVLIKRKIAPTLRQISTFLSDWAGEPARPGVKRRPGVMERIEGLEYQFTPNNGGSFYDKVERLSEESEKHGRQTENLQLKVDLLVTYFGSKDPTLESLIRKQDEIGLH